MRKFLVEAQSPALAWADQLSSRLRRTTMRERMLLGGLVTAALIYAPVAAFEWRSNQEDGYINAVTDRAAAKLSRDSARRIASNAADSAAVADMKSWGFEASNVAIAQVLIERRLVEAVTDTGLTNVRITMDDKVEQIGSVQWLGGEIQADLVWRGVFGTLDNIARWSEGYRVTSFNYQLRPTQPGFVAGPDGRPIGSVRIGVSFPVSVPVTDAEHGDATSPMAAS